MLGVRLIVGTALAAALLGLLCLDGYLSAQPAPLILLPGLQLDVGPWLYNGFIAALVVLVLTVAATHELVRLARARGYRPFGVTAQFFAAVLAVGSYVSANLAPITGGYDPSWGLLWLAIALGYVFLLQAIRYGTENAMENLAITIFIVFYTGGLAGFLTKLRMEVGGATGMAVVVFSVFLVKMNDVGAYFVGNAVGRHKLVAWLSPKKTWEGFIGGFLTTVVCALAVGRWLHLSGLVRLEERYVSYPWALLLLGLLLGTFSVAGDLAASLLKRDARVKDSGRALPGLGGVLDILDSPLLAAPVAWLFWTRLFHVLPAS